MTQGKDQINAPQPAQTVRLAASLIVLHEGDESAAPSVLLAERSQAMRFAGGASVFPGGQVEAQDSALAQQIADSLPAAIDQADAAARIAAIRETLEETGLAVAIDGISSAAEIAAVRAELLDGADFASTIAGRNWRLQPETLVPFARWLPKGLAHSHIFDTRFYLASLHGAAPADLTADGEENRRVFWASASEALEQGEAGAIKLIFPTRRNLERLAQFESFAAARRHAEAIPIKTITPWVEVHEGREWLTIPSDAGYPICREELDKAMRG